MRLIVLIALLIGSPLWAREPDPNAPARDGKPRIWRALTGDLMELDGKVLALEGVACEPVVTKDGRRAKALLNTFLRAGHVRCEITTQSNPPRARCAVNGRDLTQSMQTAPGCQKINPERQSPTLQAVRPAPPPTGQDLLHLATGTAIPSRNASRGYVLERRIGQEIPASLRPGASNIAQAMARAQLGPCSLPLFARSLGHNEFDARCRSLLNSETAGWYRTTAIEFRLRPYGLAAVLAGGRPGPGLSPGLATQFLPFQSPGYRLPGGPADPLVRGLRGIAPGLPGTQGLAIR